MEQSANLHLLRGADGETMSARVLALLAELGYLGRAAILDAADFGVPQHRKRTIIFAHRGDEAPQQFPPIPTHTQPVRAGAVLAPPFAGPVLAGTVLARVRAAVNMTAAEVRQRRFYPHNAYRVMDMTRPSATLKTNVHAAAGPYTLRDGEAFHTMTPQDMLALQSFPRAYILPAVAVILSYGIAGQGRPQGKMGSENKRRERDVMKLMMNDYKVEMVNDRINEFHVEFVGPKDSPYEGGHWKLHVQLSDAYPYESPSITFVNRIYHPNVHKSAGHVCLDVINENWSPMFDLVNVFEVFLPQLLLYPNTAHGLNDEAAAMLMHEPTAFNKKVQEYVQRYAKAEDIHAVWGGMMPFAQQLMMMTRLLSATPALGEVIPLTKRTRQPLPIQHTKIGARLELCLTFQQFLRMLPKSSHHHHISAGKKSNLGF
eukprot:jgi/Tetstr1/434350/TSEL_023456.t3